MVIIGSGATAITLLPKLAEKAEKTTMLQRSPYVVPLPNKLQPRWLVRLQHRPKRVLLCLISRAPVHFFRAFPRLARKCLRSATQPLLPAHIPYDPHFTPHYNPLDQALCPSPNGDFFAALRSGRADVQTDTIRQVVADGIELMGSGSGGKDIVPADIIVTATGPKVELFGQAVIEIDGKPLHVPDKYVWHRMMIQDMPNSFLLMGYTSIPWTLGVDVAARIAVRLMKTMQREGTAVATPRIFPPSTKLIEHAPILDLSSTYFREALKDLPRGATNQGPSWKPSESYIKDVLFAAVGNVKRDLEFVKGQPPTSL